MPDARCTRGLVCKLYEKKRTRAYRAAENIRHSLRNGSTAYDALAPENLALLSPSPLRNLARQPGRAFRTSQRPLTEFIPPCNPFPRTMPPRPPHPIPTFGNDGQRPFLRDRMA